VDLRIKPIAAICKSLAGENMLRIRFAIGDEKGSISQIVESTGFSQPVIAHHFSEPRPCHLVTVDATADISVPSSIKAVT